MSKFDGKGFYHLGVTIAEEHANEAGYRTAIGRVYYACFLVGLNATKRKGWFQPKNGAGDHSGLSRALRDKGKEQIAHKLIELYRLREHADYHTEICPTGECSCCDKVCESNNLVDYKTWQKAQIIADNILSKLESINPRHS